MKTLIIPDVHERPNLPAVRLTDPRTLKEFVCPYLNITVEHTNYSPLSLDEIKAKIEALKEGVQ